MRKRSVKKKDGLPLFVYLMNFFKITEYFIFLQLLKGHKVNLLCL